MAPPSSWFPIPASSQFSLANIPFGIITTSSRSQPRPAIAIGEHVLDLEDFANGGGFSEFDVDLSVFSKPTLNAFAALGRNVHRKVRKYIQDVFADDSPYSKILKENAGLQKSCLLRQDDVEMHLPMQIGDYTDFYAGKNHAFNVGCLFRGPENALNPNYTHIPVGYHGRASSVVVSGTPITRPNGQILVDTAKNEPTLAPCKNLDIEVELGAFLCKNNEMGTPVAIAEAEDSIFGVVLLNDWSARDIQRWEYVPLGPFNAKNFGSTISPWVVTIDALEPFRTTGIKNDTQILPYLQEKKDSLFDINLSVELGAANQPLTNVLNSNGKHLLFSFPQMLAHHSIGGCPMRVGDLLGSGTISGTESGSQGSFLELSKGGREAFKVQGGAERTFLQDGDTVVLTGVCGTEETGLVGFGECRGTIKPSPKV